MIEEIEPHTLQIMYHLSSGSIGVDKFYISQHSEGFRVSFQKRQFDIKIEGIMEKIVDYIIKNPKPRECDSDCPEFVS